MVEIKIKKTLNNTSTHLINSKHISGALQIQSLFFCQFYIVLLFKSVKVYKFTSVQVGLCLCSVRVLMCSSQNLGRQGSQCNE